MATREEAKLLVLSRKKNESISIAGGEIIVSVIEIRGDKVRLGVQAPADIPVHRLEVQEAIERQERAKLDQQRQQQRDNPSD